MKKLLIWSRVPYYNHCLCRFCYHHAKKYHPKRFPLPTLWPRPHYTVFKRKRYCFVPDTATIHTTTVRKRTVSKTLSRVERFENGTVWKRCFPSVDGENDTIWKRWRHHNNTTTQPWVYKIADRRFRMVSLLKAVIFSFFTLLEAHLTLLRQIFDFSRRE